MTRLNKTLQHNSSQDRDRCGRYDVLHNPTIGLFDVYGRTIWICVSILPIWIPHIVFSTEADLSKLLEK